MSTATAHPSDFSDRLRRLRSRLGLSQQEFARRLGTTNVTLSRLETGRNPPSAKLLAAFQRAEEEEFASTDLPASEPANSAAQDFSSPAQEVASVIEAHRLSFGHLSNPGFAAELSRVDPLPHQRIAVYDHLLPQERLRFLLADDAGAGKTIMAGLYIREMLARRRIRRVMVVPPAGLVGNWFREMNHLFSLPFRVLTGGMASKGNPFQGEGSDLVIVSVDTLSSDRWIRRLQEPETEAYDLVIFDEAHKLSARQNADGSMDRTDRYRLAEAMTGCGKGADWRLPWEARHLLLMTATPHMGAEYPYYALWRLLDPQIFTSPEVLGELDPAIKSRYFLRRTKEEMVDFAGQRLYPPRRSKTWTYELTPGVEQELYDETTKYIRLQYNKCRMLNRSAARLAMSVFQRRLASSAYALMKSFERRLEKLDGWIGRIQGGELDFEHFVQEQLRLETRPPKDVFLEETADEERSDGVKEQNEESEEDLLVGVVASSLADLQLERHAVEALRAKAKQVWENGEGSKFQKLMEALHDPDLANEKILLFTEHRDTLVSLVERFGAMGFEGRVSKIHGGMAWPEREQELSQFRKPLDEGGSQIMVCTDAAGEGLNMQFCWLMFNYDIPWNPARIEQRFGRIHRYGQKHPHVFLYNLVAGSTREGKVLAKLLEKLETIRAELGSDKVFDILGEQFKQCTLKELMEQALIGQDDAAAARIDCMLTAEGVAKASREIESRYPTSGDVVSHLEEHRNRLEREGFRRLLPGHIRRFLERSAPLMGIEILGDLEKHFRMAPMAHRPGACDWMAPLLDKWDAEAQDRLTLYRPAPEDQAIYLHPGQSIFDTYCRLVQDRFGTRALVGGCFADPWADSPYFAHLAQVSVLRDGKTFLSKLVAVRQNLSGDITLHPLEQLVLLDGLESVPAAFGFAVHEGERAIERAARWVRSHVMDDDLSRLRDEAQLRIPERTHWVTRGFDQEEIDLAMRRSRLNDRVRKGDNSAKKQMQEIRELQEVWEERRKKALEDILREPEMFEGAPPVFLAHALVVPSTDPIVRERHDREIEKIAMRAVMESEERAGRVVQDVSTPERAVFAGLGEWPGFDFLSKLPDGSTRAIEVKGRSKVGDVQISENEWAKACTLRDKYWLYVVFDCATANPRLVRVQDPFGKLIEGLRGGVTIKAEAILAASQDA